MGKKVLFINQEIAPYVPNSEMANFGADMPRCMQDAGFEIRTFMPKWAAINERRGQLHEVIRLSGMNLLIDDMDHPLIIKVASIPQTRIQVYFIDNEDYFQKRLAMTKDELGNDYPDNGERAIFFARGVLETFYVKTAYKDEPQFAKSKVVTSLFTEQPRGSLGKKFKQCLEFKSAELSLIEKYGDNFDFKELGKLVIDYSDGIIQTSNNVNKELIQYAKDNKKEILLQPDNEEEVKTKYTEFYNKIIE